jgi:hypothetical protein
MMGMMGGMGGGSGMGGPGGPGGPGMGGEGPMGRAMGGGLRNRDDMTRGKPIVPKEESPIK